MKGSFFSFDFSSAFLFLRGTMKKGNHVDTS